MDATEYKSCSRAILFTPLGAPEPPRLRINSVGTQSATLEWIPAHYARPELISGYSLTINSAESQLFGRDDREFLFQALQPGKSYKLEIAAITNAIIGKSKPSNAITLMCPNRPDPPLISQMPTVRPNSVVVGWKPAVEAADAAARSSNKFDQILCYK
jgi:hypothetical protein